MAVDQPSPTRPTTLPALVRASVRKTSLNEECPAALTIGRTTTPGWSMGTSRNDRPRCFAALGSVRASRKIQFAVVPADVQILWPLITHSSPSSTPLVRTEARSEPASGSEKPWHHRCLPLRMRGRKCRFCASEPRAIRVLPSRSIPSRSFSARSGAPARANSSASTTCSIGDRPPPPYSVGQDTATRPAPARARRQCRANSSRSWGGSAPGPGHPGGRCSATNSRIRSRNASASGG